MNERGEVFDALLRAARSDDPAAFDTAFDQTLERARDAAQPQPELQALVARRLRAAPGAGATGELGSTGVAPGGGLALFAPAPHWARYLRGLGILAAGIAIGFAWGRSPKWWPSDAGVPEGVQFVAPTETASATPSAAAPSPPRALADDSSAGDAPFVAAPASTEVPAAPLVPPRPVAVPARATRAPEAQSLRLALEQLRKAQLALRAGAPRRALEALDWLDARVPAQVLQEEREVTRTLAWCDTGDARDQAKASELAQRLLARAPDSAYAVSLRESCAGQAALLEQMREHTSNRER